MKVRVLAIAPLVLIIMLAAQAPLQAYLDPGSGSMLMQLLLGGVAGLAVILKLAWRRVSEWFRAPRIGEQTNTRDE